MASTRYELEMLSIAICLEGFFYGKISVPCALTCTPAKEVQLFPGLGLYSGIFITYLHCSSSKSRTATTGILFYALRLLYVLSTATVVSDLVAFILEVSNNSICNTINFSYQFYRGRGVSGHYQFHFKLTPSLCYFAFILSKPQQAVVATSSPNVLWCV